MDSDRPVSTMVEIQCLLDNVGTSELVIDLIVNTKNDRVFEESILLGIALLQGGNTQIQVSSNYFMEFLNWEWSHAPSSSCFECHAKICLNLFLRSPSTTNCTSRRSQRSSSKSSTTACAWLSRRSGPPCRSTCLSSAPESETMTVKSAASDIKKVL